MDIQDIRAQCLSFPATNSYFPFGPEIECFRVGGKLRCEAMYADFFRQQYPRTVLRPYHSPRSQQPYGNIAKELSNQSESPNWKFRSI